MSHFQQNYMHMAFVVFALTLRYLLKRKKERVKISGSFSTWNETGLDVPQGSVITTLLFNISVTDIFNLMNGTEIRNYADYTALYSCDYELKNAITKLEQNANHLAACFLEIYMKLSEDRCCLITFCPNKERTNIHITEV